MLNEASDGRGQRGPSPNETITRIVVRPLASALPLGFFAFAIGTTLLATVELKWIPKSESLAVVIVLLGYVAPLEFIPCIFGFLSRDTGAATTMGIFSMGWVVLGLNFLMFGTAAKSTTLGIFMILDSLAIFSLSFASMSAKPLMGVILSLSAVRFLLAAVIQLGGGTAVSIAAGAVGLLTGVLALYGGLALLLEDTRQKSVLPVLRRRAAEQSLEGTLHDQLARLEKEAGVRQQL